MRRAPVALCSFLATACSAGAGTTPPEASPAHAGDWTCVGRAVAVPRATVEPTGPFVVSLQDAGTHARLPGLRLAVCARADEDCATPVSQGMTDDRGEAKLSAGSIPPSSFDGFLRVSGPGIAPHFVFLREREGACASCALVVPLYTPSALHVITRMTGLALDARSGLVRAELEDCAGAPARDVSLSIGSFGCSEVGAREGFVKRGSPFFGPDGGCAGPVVAYATGGHGDVTRAALATDATGVAFGFGVPPGPLAVVELLDGNTAAGALGFARGGAVSEFVLRP